MVYYQKEEKCCGAVRTTFDSTLDADTQLFKQPLWAQALLAFRNSLTPSSSHDKLTNSQAAWQAVNKGRGFLLQERSFASLPEYRGKVSRSQC